MVEQAQMLLACRENPSFFAAARRVGGHHQTVQRCVERALAYGPLVALDDRPRPGKEPTITPEAKAWLVSLACDKAKEHGYPHELWTTRLLARHAREHGPAAGHRCLARLVRGTVCKITQPGRNQAAQGAPTTWSAGTPRFEQEDGGGSLRLSQGRSPQAGGRQAEENRQAGGDRLLRRKAGNPGHRHDVAGFAARAWRPPDLRA